MPIQVQEFVLPQTERMVQVIWCKYVNIHSPCEYIYISYCCIRNKLTEVGKNDSEWRLVVHLILPSLLPDGKNYIYYTVGDYSHS